MVKRPGCVSHFLSSEAEWKRKAIWSLPLPPGARSSFSPRSQGEDEDRVGAGGGSEDSEVAMSRPVMEGWQ